MRVKMLRANFFDATDVFDRFFNGAVNALTPEIVTRRFEPITKNRALYYEISRDKAKNLYGVTFLYGIYKEGGVVLAIHLTRGRVRGRAFTREEGYREAHRYVRDCVKLVRKAFRRRKAK